eukprot:TRINITY_DN7669_c0_g3_i2.p1 TRINITY_DN7669_c0_g3~~TRINITY_DN7669_c0_g3_i2.p1  ORF type:complete len:646 (+),score=131.12 TRINITY_DN7669_c0_g3_i2:69-2006(+)
MAEQGDRDDEEEDEEEEADEDDEDTAWAAILLSKQKARLVESGECILDEFAAGMIPTKVRLEESDESDEKAADMPRDSNTKADRYIKFRMWKRCTDTLEAIGTLASTLSVPVSKFGFAGIKDSRAVTCQEVTVPRLLTLGHGTVRVTAKDVAYAAAKSGGCIRVGGFGLCDTFLWPGRLQGNRFGIKVRGVVADNTSSSSTSTGALPDNEDADAAMRSRVEKAVLAVNARGFVNYVGMQRFGKAGVRSDLVGRAYLQGDYEACVELIIFGPPDGTNGNAASWDAGGGARNDASVRQKRWRTRLPPWADVFRRTWSANAAIHAMSDHTKARLWVEMRLLLLIRKIQHQQDENAQQLPWPELCRQVFLRLPRNIRTLYIFAYFDRLWNLCASERIALSPDKPIVGDLVWTDRAKSIVKHVEAEDLESYSIFDVVLPRAGMKILTPKHVAGKLMTQYLGYDGLELSELCMELWAPDDEDWSGAADYKAEDLADSGSETPWASAEAADTLLSGGASELAEHGRWWTIAGDYRDLLCRPAKFRWTMEREDVQVNGSRKHAIEKPSLHANSKASAGGSGQLQPLVYSIFLEFDLPRGVYATMMLRELCRKRGQRAAGFSGRRGQSHVVWNSDDESEEEVDSRPRKTRRCGS